MNYRLVYFQERITCCLGNNRISLLTSGGRVTGTTAVAGSLADAIREAYRLASGVQFENAYRRSDIGQRALQAGK